MQSIWTKEEIKTQIKDCTQALQGIVKSAQAYTIGDKSFTRANISELRKLLDFWRNELSAVEAAQSGKSNIQKIRTRFL
ncbi:MAG: DUF6148 family protein [Campylobacteraceae bacterium]|jgi:hypothetical protein|nr:DUF6148 family protein [Campylobacteraceae bacterium]